jgi:NAD(P)-dependent dehydrogenase (short-subunit alcohol dehydrogenase family)
VIDVNLTGAFLGARAAARVMGGRLIFTGAVLGHTAQRRWGDATDLAGAYEFLASDVASFVTGTVLTVDGGYLLV